MAKRSAALPIPRVNLGAMAKRSAAMPISCVKLGAMAKRSAAMPIRMSRDMPAPSAWAWHPHL